MDNKFTVTYKDDDGTEVVYPQIKRKGLNTDSPIWTILLVMAAYVSVTLLIHSLYTIDKQNDIIDKQTSDLITLTGEVITLTDELTKIKKDNRLLEELGK